jgi:hypothetical protein
MGHICSASVRGFADKLRPINEGVAHDLRVIADQFDAMVEDNERLRRREKERRPCYPRYHMMVPPVCR